MDSESIRRLVVRSYLAIAPGQRHFLGDLLHDHIEWVTMHAPAQALPAPPRLNGKAAVLAGLQKIDLEIEIVRNNLELVMVDGDRAAVICDRTVRQRLNGRQMNYKVAAFLRFKDGKLIEYQGFADSFDILQQSLGQTIDLPRAYPGGG